jgi:hypothetical protein
LRTAQWDRVAYALSDLLIYVCDHLPDLDPGLR